VNYLLDTHAFIWLIEDSPKMPSTIKNMITSSENVKYLCSISLWEIAIKMSLGKLKLGITFIELLSIIKNSELKILHIEDKYLQRLLDLPFLHKDPFDRLLISSAVADDLTIITIDENIHQYDVAWVW